MQTAERKAVVGSPDLVVGVALWHASTLQPVALKCKAVDYQMRATRTTRLIIAAVAIGLLIASKRGPESLSNTFLFLGAVVMLLAISSKSIS
jgi:hypothetical protein